MKIQIKFKRVLERFETPVDKCCGANIRGNNKSGRLFYVKEGRRQVQVSQQSYLEFLLKKSS